MTRQIALMGLAMGIAGCGLLSTDVASTEREPEPVAMGTAPYMVIDLSGGPKASSYGVSYLHGVPEGGWSEQYKTTKLVLRRIEPGAFKMYGTKDVAVRDVAIGDPFYIGVFEVTQRQWELVMGDNPSYPKGAARPADHIALADVYGWTDDAKSAARAAGFLKLLRAKTRLEGFSLPNEAQWEYACRAGTATAYNDGGDDETSMDALGRHSGNVSDGRGGCLGCHAVVGSYAPNAWGLYDMHGNVREWCVNGYDGKTPGLFDYMPNVHVMRGGDYESEASRCTSYSRFMGVDSCGVSACGIRLTCSE